MKKLLLAVALVGCAFGANAQEDFAPKAGSFSTEIQFTPFSSNAVFSNGGVFSGAYFCSDKFAVMFDLGLEGTNKKSDLQYEGENPEEVTGFTKTYKGTFTIALGAKYYFYNYKRVNLYAGAKVNYYHTFAGNKEVFDVENDWYAWDNNGTGNGFGVWALTGINFNIYKGLYLGAELKAGFDDIIYVGSTAKVKGPDGTSETKYPAADGHNFNGGFKVTPTFILGWNF